MAPLSAAGDDAGAAAGTTAIFSLSAATCIRSNPHAFSSPWRRPDRGRSAALPARTFARASVSSTTASMSLASDSTAAVSGQQPSVRKRTLRISGSSPGSKRHALVVDHDELAVARHHRARRGEIERNHVELLERDVAPHVALGPIRQREDAHRLALAEPAVEQRATSPGAGGAAPSDGLPRGRRTPAPWRARLPRRAARRRKRHRSRRRRAPARKRLRLHHVGIDGRRMVERIDAARQAVVVGVHDEIEAEARAPSCRGRRSCRGTSRSCRCAAAGTAAWPARTPCAPDAAARSSPCRWNRAAPARGTAPRPRGRCGCSRPRAASRCETSAVMRPSPRGAGSCASPHSFFVLVLPPPAAGPRMSSPGWIARVHGWQPMERKPRACSGLTGTLFAAM